MVEMVKVNQVFFLQSDLDYFEKYKLQLDDELLAEKLDFGFQIFNLYQTRVLDQYARIPEMLEKGFDYEKQEYYDLDLDEIDWSSSAEELNERWRLIVKGRALNLLLAKKEWDEAKKNKESQQVNFKQEGVETFKGWQFEVFRMATILNTLLINTNTLQPRVEVARNNHQGGAQALGQVLDLGLGHRGEI